MHATQAVLRVNGMPATSLSRVFYEWEIDLIAQQRELDQRELELISRERRCRNIERRARMDRARPHTVRQSTTSPVRTHSASNTSNTADAAPIDNGADVVLQERGGVIVRGINVWTQSCDSQAEDSTVDDSTVFGSSPEIW